jgi:putative transposase
MKRSRFSEEQIIKILKAAEGGVPVEELSRQHGFSRATFYAWRRKFGGLEVDDAKRLKALEDENAKLKRVVADLTLDKQMLQDVLSRKW